MTLPSATASFELIAATSAVSTRVAHAVRNCAAIGSVGRADGEVESVAPAWGGVLAQPANNNGATMSVVEAKRTFTTTSWRRDRFRSMLMNRHERPVWKAAAWSVSSNHYMACTS